MINAVQNVEQDLEYEQFGWSDSTAINTINKFKTPTTDFSNIKSNSSSYFDILDNTICHILFLSIFIYCCIELVIETLSERRFLIHIYNKSLKNNISINKFIPLLNLR